MLTLIQKAHVAYERFFDFLLRGSDRRDFVCFGVHRKLICRVLRSFRADSRVAPLLENVEQTTSNDHAHPLGTERDREGRGDFELFVLWLLRGS
jgi:hypothetical protein